MKSLTPKVAFLGPEGTFAHLTAQKRFGDNVSLIPQPTIADVFGSINSRNVDLGIVPIENSSGGTIYETVDRLVDTNNKLIVQELLSINVRLALLGKDKKKIRIIYSHFAPLHHCETYLRDKFPSAELIEQPSTAAAVKKAVETDGAAAIGNRDSAKRYGLKVLEFPIEQDIENVTHFFVLGQHHSLAEDSTKTTIAFTLPNSAGSLYDFLTPFKDNNVNLTRILSRPIVGQPETYVFLADLAGTQKNPDVRAALNKASKVATAIRNIGSYPVRKTYDS